MNSTKCPNCEVLEDELKALKKLIKQLEDSNISMSKQIKGLEEDRQYFRNHYYSMQPELEKWRDVKLGLMGIRDLITKKD